MTCVMCVGGPETHLPWFVSFLSLSNLLPHSFRLYLDFEPNMWRFTPLGMRTLVVYVHCLRTFIYMYIHSMHASAIARDDSVLEMTVC